LEGVERRKGGGWGEGTWGGAWKSPLGIIPVVVVVVVDGCCCCWASICGNICTNNSCKFFTNVGSDQPEPIVEFDVEVDDDVDVDVVELIALDVLNDDGDGGGVFPLEIVIPPDGSGKTGCTCCTG
jgi:hypothetical protein